MAGKGGKREGAGRKKGSGNVITNDLRRMVLEVVDSLNAQGKSLAECAAEDEKWFYTNFVKPMLPKDVTIAGDEDRPLVAIIERVIVEKVTDTDSYSIPAPPTTE